jgi:hypothetical protein
VTFAPRTLADFNAELERNKAAFRNAPQLVFAEPQPEPPPPPGSFGALEAEMRARADRDLRPEARQQIDRAWEGLAADVLQKHGRRLPLEVYDCADAEQEAALTAARVAGETYIALSLAAPNRRASVEPALDRFAQLASDYCNVATRGWLSAADFAVQERRRNDWSW